MRGSRHRFFAATSYGDIVRDVVAQLLEQPHLMSQTELERKILEIGNSFVRKGMWNWLDLLHKSDGGSASLTPSSPARICVGDGGAFLFVLKTGLGLVRVGTGRCGTHVGKVYSYNVNLVIHANGFIAYCPANSDRKHPCILLRSPLLPRYLLTIDPTTLHVRDTRYYFPPATSQFSSYFFTSPQSVSASSNAAVAGEIDEQLALFFQHISAERSSTLYQVVAPIYGTSAGGNVFNVQYCASHAGGEGAGADAPNLHVSAVSPSLFPWSLRYMLPSSSCRRTNIRAGHCAVVTLNNRKFHAKI
uniref:Uncharacterized protein n=2 Tax=Lygus hesperus TaxID=30085 RepID=A0A146KR36_LYGHE